MTDKIAYKVLTADEWAALGAAVRWEPSRLPA